MDAIDQINRHLGHPGNVVLEREIEENGEKKKIKDEFKMNPVSPGRVKDVWSTLVVLKGSDSDASAIFSNLKPEIQDKIVDLCFSCLKPNYPDVDDNKLKELIARNLVQFVNHLWQNNLGMGSPDVGDIKKHRVMQRIKEKQNLYKKKQEGIITSDNLIKEG